MKRSRSDKVRHRENLRTVKIASGCAVCGYAKCGEVLEFHHLGDKELSVSNTVGYAYHRIRKELVKCVVLCANHHRELHAGVVSESAVRSYSVDGELVDRVWSGEYSDSAVYQYWR